jgi:NAD(P)-dependent dehydrogenase (short-subunit alcohol dehydrogenase family)
MAEETYPSFTKTYHNTSYAAISPSNPSLSASKKTVLVTGGGKGIGKAIAIAFAQAGARAIIITGRTKSSLDTAKQEIEAAATAKDATVLSFTADICDVEAINTVFKTVKQKVGPLDILINNAAYLDFHKSIAESDLEDYWQAFEVNIKGTLVVTRAYLTHIAETGPRSTPPTWIGINSGAAHVPYLPGYSAYSVSKLALLRIAEYLQVENPELRVFQIQPGRIATDMQKRSGIDAQDDIGKRNR